MTPANFKATRASKALVLAVSLGLCALVAYAIAGRFNALFFTVIAAAGASAGALVFIFPGSRHLALSLTSLVPVYAAIFNFFVEEVFPSISPGTTAIGFALPLAMFVIGCWLRRRDVQYVVSDAHLEGRSGLGAALLWLVPIVLVGGIVFLLSGLAGPRIDTEAAFLSAMSLIGVIVLVISSTVALFLVEAGLLFNEFFRRMAGLMVPAFAFLTFYALLVIGFAAVYTIMSHRVGEMHFRIGAVERALSFAESIHFSIVTISTVGYGDIVPVSSASRALASVEVICGVLLLLFGVSELLEYTREHRRFRRKRDDEESGPL